VTDKAPRPSLWAILLAIASVIFLATALVLLALAPGGR
jgi:hypothetical protein